MNTYELLSKNLETIQLTLRDHASLLDSLMEHGDTPVLYQCIPGCPHKQKLKETLLETIKVLEDSKKAFKSRQLESLRKKLIEVLAEND